MAKLEFKFEREIPFNRRLQISQKITKTYNDRIPVIVEKSPNSSLPEIKCKKFIVPTDILLMKLQVEVRKHIKMASNQTLYLFVSTEGSFIIPPQTATMAQLYEKYKSNDGFLYIMYSEESSFGEV